MQKIANSCDEIETEASDAHENSEFKRLVSVEEMAASGLRVKKSKINCLGELGEDAVPTSVSKDVELSEKSPIPDTILQSILTVVEVWFKS